MLRWPRLVKGAVGGGRGLITGTVTRDLRWGAGGEKGRSVLHTPSAQPFEKGQSEGGEDKPSQSGLRVEGRCRGPEVEQ